VNCEYGCNQEANFLFKNGKMCCSKNHARCPEVKKKMSRENLNRRRVYLRDKQCYHCGNFFTSLGIKRHEETCYMNLDNMKDCPVCEQPIKDYKNTETCSSKCARQHFKDMYDEFGREGKNLHYRTICFMHHKKECIICGEKHIVSTHHYDYDKENSDPRNLVPMCPTHHMYMHSRFRYLIKKRVDEYVEAFIKKHEKAA